MYADYPVEANTFAQNSQSLADRANTLLFSHRFLCDLRQNLTLMLDLGISTATKIISCLSPNLKLIILKVLIFNPEHVPVYNSQPKESLKSEDVMAFSA